MKTVKGLGNVLATLTLVGTAGVALSALPIVASLPAMAQSQGPAALAGKVTSQEEGAMEGVVVSAKRPDSTIMVSVVSNAQGEFSFPKNRLEPGLYNITMRAIGYKLEPTTANVPASGAGQIDLKLAKAKPHELALQLSNSELMQSAPGTAAQNTAMLRCLDCHGLQRPFFSKKNAEQMAYTVQRMGTHASNSSPDFPFYETTANAKLSQPPSKADADFGAYIASINLSQGDTWPYPVKTLPRPKGKATQVIMTTYDLPGLAAPHDTLRDPQGNVWFTHFQEMVIGKLDPKTGKVTLYPVPIAKPDSPTGGLMITMDKNGMIWEAMMGQAELARLDPATGKVTTFLSPDWKDPDARFTMIDALHSNVDGHLWTKVNNGLTNRLFRVDIETGKFTEVPAPAGMRTIAGYGLVSDLDNNQYSLDNNPTQRKIWRVDAKTGALTFFDLPAAGGARRGHIDAQNRLWFSQFYGNRYGMLDPKTGKVTLWEVPIQHAGAYDVGYDDVKYAWGADMSTDLVQRLDPETGDWTSYLLPISINTRHIDVQKTDNPYGVSSMWTEGQQNGKIVHIEPYGG